MKKRRLFTLFNTYLFGSLPFLTLACSQSNYLVGRGANSISPIVNLVSKNTIFNVIYSPDGSTFGAREMARNSLSIDFGTASSLKVPGTLFNVPGIDYSNVGLGLEEEIENWNKNSIRTLTFGIDAIGIGINLPPSLKNALGTSAPITNFDALAMLYALNDDDPNFPTWKDLLVNPEIQALPLANAKPIPLAIEGGIETSGKSEAFINKIIKDSTWFQAHKDKLNLETIEHHENIPAQNKVSDRDQEIYSKNNAVVGSVMYYSLGYLLKNTGQDKVVISTITQQGKTPDWAAPTLANAQSGAYPWIRPLNIFYSTNNQIMIDLVQTALLNQFQALINQIGFVNLNQAQIELQSMTHSLKESDLIVNKDSANFNYGLILSK